MNLGIKKVENLFQNGGNAMTNQYHTGGDFYNVSELKKLHLLLALYKERGASPQEWRDLEDAIRQLAQPAVESVLDATEQECASNELMHPEACIQCDSPKAIERMR
mgnify:CR=1 FL=1